MLYAVFVLLIVGFPAGYGAFALTHSREPKERELGGFLLLYALALAGGYFFFLPEGKTMGARHTFNVPVVIGLSLAVGFLTGLYKNLRRR
ncbi:hypothetical protein PSA7680_00343 [Pseudoruegeria aquimaris]|uniref:Uncharacterized protein n=1 Tax=Pseudoruegeria aquimaris TaxID=393663 RepID=A0A1Y5RE40_9RHOB|nr:hypothetical protein [Pseudoruegeria aquimaris]SLN14499.1 hypothetical protein PSA7680_00343 [Pseudoruegeria aquimaris]